MTGKADAVNFMYKSKYFIVLTLVAVLVTAQASSAYSISSSTVATYNQFSFVTPQSYTVFTDGTTTYAKSGATGAIDYRGTDAVTVIESAFNGLTAGRTWKETVTLTGTFTINSQIDIPSYTTLVINGKLIQASGSSFAAIIKNKNVGVSLDSNIEITGGIIDGNKGTGTNANGIVFDGVKDSSIHDMTIKDVGGASARGIYLITSDTSRQTENIQLNNLLLDGATSSNIEAAGLITGNLDQGAVRGMVITNVVSINPGGRGLVFSNGRDSVVNGLYINNTGFRGLDLSFESTRNTITNFYIGFTTLDGLTVAHSPGTDESYHNTFSNFVIYHAGQAGIGSNARDLVFSNFLINASGFSGIRHDGNNCVIADGIIKNNGQTTPATYSGILINTADRCIISNNRIFDSQTSKTQYYGVALSANTTNIRVIGNDLTGNTQVKGISDAGTSNLYYENGAFRTQNTVQSGTFAIDSTGVKTLTTAHGLAYTPSAKDCSLTVFEVTNVDDWGYDLLKIDSVDATNVVAKIHVSTPSATVGALARIGISCIRP